MKAILKKHSSTPKGLTLIEVVIGLALVGVLVITFSVSLTASVAARRIKHRNIAAALVDQELNVLKNMSAATVPVQTDGPLLGVLYMQGSWEVMTDITAPSGSMVLQTTSTGSGISSVMPLPKNAYDDFTLTADAKVLSTAPAGWQMGLLFRANDLQNGYMLYLDASSLTVDVVIDGTPTELYSDIRSISEDSWQELSVVASGGSLTIKLNGLTITTINDPTFASGKAALLTWEGATANFDDVIIEGSTEDMESTASGEIPDGWERFGLSVLPGNAAADLTVAELFGDSSFKRYTTEVHWIDGSSNRTFSESTDKVN